MIKAFTVMIWTDYYIFPFYFHKYGVLVIKNFYVFDTNFFFYLSCLNDSAGLLIRQAQGMLNVRHSLIR